MLGNRLVQYVKFMLTSVEVDHSFASAPHSKLSLYHNKLLNEPKVWGYDSLHVFRTVSCWISCKSASGFCPIRFRSDDCMHFCLVAYQTISSVYEQVTTTDLYSPVTHVFCFVNTVRVILCSPFCCLSHSPSVNQSGDIHRCSSHKLAAHLNIVL